MKKKFIICFSLIIILIIFLGIIYYFIPEKDNNIDKDINNIEKQTQEEKEKESDDILKKINKLFVAPEEEPIVSRITDVNQPSMQQAFFSGVEDGDYLLIYKDAGKAILYSAKENKILNMGPFNSGE